MAKHLATITTHVTRRYWTESGGRPLMIVLVGSTVLMTIGVFPINYLTRRNVNLIVMQLRGTYRSSWLKKKKRLSLVPKLPSAAASTPQLLDFSTVGFHLRELRALSARKVTSHWRHRSMLFTKMVTRWRPKRKTLFTVACDAMTSTFW